VRAVGSAWHWLSRQRRDGRLRWPGRRRRDDLRGERPGGREPRIERAAWLRQRLEWSWTAARLRPLYRGPVRRRCRAARPARGRPALARPSLVRNQTGRPTHYRTAAVPAGRVLRLLPGRILGLGRRPMACGRTCRVPVDRVAVRRSHHGSTLGYRSITLRERHSNGERTRRSDTRVHPATTPASELQSAITR